jgi:hypothetical protein
MILDSSYLIDLMQGDPDAHEKARTLNDRSVGRVVPAPALFEIQYGAERMLDGRERRRVNNVTRMYPTLPVTQQTARRAGELLASADHAAGGESGIDMIDPLIAATGDVTKQAVVTDNVDDFEALGVEVEPY